MKGFTIICNDCGNKAIITTKKDESYSYIFMSSDNETLKFEGDSMERELVCSECGNKITEEK